MPDSLRSLLMHVTDPEGPGFYRTLYGLKETEPALTLQTQEEWRALPFLTKKALLEAPLEARCFVPPWRIDSFYASSGTTGSLPLFGPRACTRGPEYRSAFHAFARPCLSSIILPHMTEHALRAAGSPGRVIALDPKRMRASVALAKAAHADSVLAHGFLMPLLCDALEAAGIAERIRYVEIAGEPCSEAQFERMRAALPNATITPVYGAREVEGPIGLPCRPLGGEPLEVYHPNPDYLLELIDAEGRVVEPTAGVEAELLVTAYAGEPFAFPLLRYRIGDRVKVVDAACAAHGTWSFAVQGRAETDFLKLPGGMLRVDEIERVLKALGAPAPAEFHAHLSDTDGQDGPSVRVTLRCVLPPSLSPADFAARAASMLRVAPAYTYAQGVAEGVYLPLVHEPLPAQASPGKRVRITRGR